ncbi:unnamed protein product [Penicillium palitans]
MKRGGEITGFAEVAKLYCLRYGVAKAFNDSPDVSNELQNVMLQYASIDTFVRHYSVGRQRNRLIRENLERYKNEQLVIDSERQLSGKVVDEEVLVALERTGYMTLQYMTLIDTVLTMPGTTIKKEYKRRIAAINAVIAVCDAEEGAPSRRRMT